jgi:hypothetical protein
MPLHLVLFVVKKQKIKSSKTSSNLLFLFLFQPNTSLLSPFLFFLSSPLATRRPIPLFRPRESRSPPSLFSSLLFFSFPPAHLSRSAQPAGSYSPVPFCQLSCPSLSPGRRQAGPACQAHPLPLAAGAHIPWPWPCRALPPLRSPRLLPFPSTSA